MSFDIRSICTKFEVNIINIIQYNIWRADIFGLDNFLKEIIWTLLYSFLSSNIFQLNSYYFETLTIKSVLAKSYLTELSRDFFK